MRRFTHRLKRNKREATPHDLLFYDCEAYMEKQADGSILLPFRLATAIYWRRAQDRHKDQVESYTLYDPGEFADLLEEKARGGKVLTVSAFNLNADFIIADVQPEMTKRGWFCHLPYVSGRVKMATLHLPTPAYAKHMTQVKPKAKFVGNRWCKTIEFVDLANYYDGDLATIGASLGLPKFHVDLMNATTEELIPYCQRDTEIVYRAWRWLLELWDAEHLGNWCKTLGGLAMAAYKHRFMQKSIYVHDRKKAVNLEYRSYHGGRCDVFQVGRCKDDRYYHVDVNGAFAYKMRDNEYPTRLVDSRNDGSLELLKEKVKDYLVVADVTLFARAAMYPTKVDDYSAYPLGEFKTTLTTRLLKLALERNEIMDVGAMAWYEKDVLFKDFVDYVYGKEQICKTVTLRLEGKRESRPLTSTEEQELLHARLQAKFWKSIRNSLYGKWAQHELEDVFLGEVSPDEPRAVAHIDAIKKILYQVYYIGNQKWGRKKGGASFNAVPTISAHIADDVRMYLWELMNKAGLDHCLACDTDGFWCDSLGVERLSSLLHETKLGCLKVDHVSSWLEVKGRKWYEWEGGEVCKGRSKNAVPLGVDEFEQEQWPSLLTTLGTEQPGVVKVERTRKHFSHRLHGGEVTPDGRVRPYVLDGDAPCKTSINEALTTLREQVCKFDEEIVLPHLYVRDHYSLKRRTVIAGTYHVANESGRALTHIEDDCLLLGYPDPGRLGKVLDEDGERLYEIEVLKRRILAYESIRDATEGDNQAGSRAPLRGAAYLRADPYSWTLSPTGKTPP